MHFLASWERTSKIRILLSSDFLFPFAPKHCPSTPNCRLNMSDYQVLSERDEGKDSSTNASEEYFDLDPTLPTTIPKSFCCITTENLFSPNFCQLLDKQSDALTIWTTGYAHKNSESTNNVQHEQKCFQKRYQAMLRWSYFISVGPRLPRVLLNLISGLSDHNGLVLLAFFEMLIVFIVSWAYSDCGQKMFIRGAPNILENHKMIAALHRSWILPKLYSGVLSLCKSILLLKTVEEATLEYDFSFVGGGIAKRRHISNLALLMLWWNAFSDFLASRRFVMKKFMKMVLIYRQEMSPREARWVEKEIRESLLICTFWRFRIPWNRKIIGLQVDETLPEDKANHHVTPWRQRCGWYVAHYTIMGFWYLFLGMSVVSLIHLTFWYKHICFICPTQKTNSDPCLYPEGYPLEYYRPKTDGDSAYACNTMPPPPPPHDQP